MPMTFAARSAAAACLTIAVVVLNSAAHAATWPQWRGPANDGRSDAGSLPTEWDPGRNIAWRVALPGPGPATPVVWNDRIFLTSAKGKDLALIALTTDGTKLWTRILDSGNRDFRSGESNMAAPSPVTDGEHVWIVLGTGLVTCYNYDGREVWNFNLQDRYERIRMYHGYSSTPLLDGDRLYIQALHSNQQLVLALDKRTGKTIWKRNRRTDAREECLHSYASPVIHRHGGAELLLIHGADYMTAHRLKDGRELWRVGGLQAAGDYNPMLRFVATPVSAEGLIVVPSAKNGPVLGIRPAGARGNITNSKEHVVWRLDHGTPDVPSPVIHGGLVYLSRENGEIICLDAASGQVVYKQRPSRARHRGSPLVADGKLYLMGMDGTVTVLRTGRKFELLAQNRLDEQLAASLAVGEGTLYLRTYDALYAIRNN